MHRDGRDVPFFQKYIATALAIGLRPPKGTRIKSHATIGTR